MPRRTTALLRAQNKLPPIHHHEINCPLTKPQAAHSVGQPRDFESALERSSPQRRFCLVRSSLLELQQITCHPSLVLGRPDVDGAGSGKVQALVAPRTEHPCSRPASGDAVSRSRRRTTSCTSIAPGTRASSARPKAARPLRWLLRWMPCGRWNGPASALPPMS